MHFIYIGVSGATGTALDPNQPFHLISAIMVDAGKVQPIEEDMLELGLRFFGEQARDRNLEFHGRDIQKGRGAFKAMPVGMRQKLLDALVAILTRHDVRIGYSAIDKMRASADNPPHEHAFRFLVEKIEDCLRLDGNLGLLIADDAGLAANLPPSERIVDALHVVEAKNSRLIQLADLAAYLLLRGLRTSRRLAVELADTTPKIDYHDWLERHASPAQVAEDHLYLRLEQRLRFWKMFPEDAANQGPEAGAQWPKPALG